MPYNYKLKICPLLLHAQLINAQLYSNQCGYGYCRTDPHDDSHDTYAQCIGKRCMLYEWNEVCGWCGLTKD